MQRRNLALSLVIISALYSIVVAQAQRWVPSTIEGCDGGCTVTNLHFFSPTDGWATGIGWDSARQQHHPVLLRTSDGGGTWQVAPLSLPENYIYERAFFLNAMEGWAPADRSIGGLSGIDDADLEEYALDAPIRFYQTSDGGNSWQLRQGEIVEFEVLGNATSLNEVNWKYVEVLNFVSRSVGVMAGTLTRSPAQPGVNPGYRGYVIAVTRDGGATWKVFLFGLDDFCGQNPDRALAFHPPMDIEFVGERYGWIPALTCERRYLFRTDDAGQSWEVVDIRDPYPNTVGTHLEFVSPNEGWSAGHVRVTRTMDSGRTWIRDQSIAGFPLFISTQEGWYLGYPQISEGGSGLGQHGVYRTEDGGLSWELEFDTLVSGVLLWDKTSQRLWLIGFEAIYRRVANVTSVSLDGALPATWGALKNNR